MFNPIRYVDNNFEDPHLSDANLRSFSEDHLVRLANPDNNPGSIYSTLLTDTNTKYTAYYGKMSSEAVKKAIAEGSTVTRNNARKAAEEKIGKLQGLAKFKFGEDSAIYQELYPLGVREYLEAREGDIGTLFDRFVEAATTHLTADYPTEVTAIDDLVDAFHLAYTARETVVSQVDVLITGKNADRIALTTQLTKNFLIIASDNISNPDKYDDYYDPRFLPITTESTEQPPITFPITHTASLNMTIANTYDLSILDAEANPTLSFLFESIGTSVMRFYATDNAGGLPGVGSSFDLLGGTTVTKTVAELVAELGLNETNHFLGVQNVGTSPGSYKITISV